MKLVVTGRYASGDRQYRPGQELEVSAEEGAFLLRDSPGSFEVVEQTAGVVESVTRIMRGGRRRA